MDRQSAIESLKNHHSTQHYRPEANWRNVVHADEHYLGPYIPYIGIHYFESKPKLLIYAMAQNLAKEKGQKLIKDWSNTEDKGLLRQYYHEDAMHVSVHPYDNGHLKVIAALILSIYPNTNFVPSQSVHERIVITNFAKFSFFKRGKDNQLLDKNPPLEIYDDMWKYYSAYEVELLKPDIIVGVGKDVSNAIRRNLDKGISFLEISFPGRVNLNSHFVPKGKILKEQGYDYISEIVDIKSLLRGTPDNGEISKVIETDWYYFKNTKEFIERVLARN